MATNKIEQGPTFAQVAAIWPGLNKYLGKTWYDICAEFETEMEADKRAARVAKLEELKSIRTRTSGGED